MYPVENGTIAANVGAPKPYDPAVIQKIIQQAQQQQAVANAGGSGFVAMPNFTPTPYSGPSAGQMAQEQFAPQYEILQNIINQTQQRYNTAYSDVGSIYNQLGDKIAGQADQIRGQYDQTGQQVGSAYNNAINAVSNSAQQNEQAIAEMLARLGIAQQAAPTALNSIGSEMEKAVGSLAQNMASRQGFNSQQGQNELSYNQRTADVDRLVGKNAQRDLTTNFQNAQFANDQKKLEIMSQQKAAENQYAQAIAKMQQDSATNGFDQWYKMQTLQNSMGQNAAQNDLGRARLMLDTDKFENDVNQYKQTSQLNSEKALNSSGDAYAILASRAGQMFGQNSPQAADAVQRIIRAYQTASADHNGTATLADVQQYAAFNSQTSAEAQAMMGLATVWYQQLGNKQPYGYNY
jgi:hypothetical protein